MSEIVCLCGCGLKMTTEGTVVTLDQWHHWIQKNMGHRCSGSLETLADGRLLFKYSPELTGILYPPLMKKSARRNTMLKMRYELNCDGCGKAQIITELRAFFDREWRPPLPVLPEGWKEVGDAHFCPGHEIAVKVYDDEPGGKVYYDSLRGAHSVVR